MHSSTPSLLALAGGVLLTACAPDGELRYSDHIWPGMDDPSADPWDFQGRIDVEICDGIDNNGDGIIDEGCTGTCDNFTTRLPDYWAAETCVLDGTATGFTPFPINLGASETYTTSAAVVTALSIDPAGDAHLKLRKQLLTAKLNMTFFALDDIQVTDWDGDGTPETFAELVTLADAQYDSGIDWIQNVWYNQLWEMNHAGTGMPQWYDDACSVAAEYCDGIDNDGDGLIDEDCGCIETCGDSYDNDFDGFVDEGCTACTTYQSRSKDFWTGGSCVLDGTLGLTFLPITLGSADTYTTSSAVIAAISADLAGGDPLLRLRRQLLIAKINRIAFGKGADLVADYNSDGTLETLDELIALGDTYYDSGASYLRIWVATALRTANKLGDPDPIWFRADCATDGEFCDLIDNDGDGVVDEDCGCVEACDGYDNDYDGSIDEDYPAGCPTAEICDGIDNDGDGLIDEPDATDAQDWYIDADSDTYGDLATFTHECYAPTGYVADNTDCNDANAAVYPGATDVCDGVDNNCDGTIDDQGPTLYRDKDGDSYGDPGNTTTLCSPTVTYISDNTDCDDNSALTYPGALDTCGDGIDQDCNGSEVGCYSPVGTGDASFVGESAGDQAGISAARVGDVDGDGVDDVLFGARYNDAGGTDAGAAYLFYGPVTYTGEVSLANADLKLVGNLAGDRAGRTTIGGADLNGDGTADVTIGAPNEDTSGTSAGAAYVFFGTTLSGFVDPTVAMSSADFTVYGRDAYDYLGARTSYSELTGDATVDLLLSVTGDSVSATTAGGIYVYAGPISAGSVAISDGTWAARITGETAADQIGLAVGTNGDLNGDGSGDVVVGVPRQDGASTDAGATYLVSGPLSGTIGLTAADAKINGDSTGDKLGSAVSMAGDQNADGYDDFYTTAPFDDTTASNAGSVYLVYGAATLSSLDASAISSVASAFVRGKETSGQVGSSVAGDGDHDGDGTFDLLTGANNDGPSAEGATYLYLGPVSGTLAWTDADYSFSGATAYDHTGSFVSYGGDLRSLGRDALIIGGPEADFGSSADSGKVYVVFQATP